MVAKKYRASKAERHCDKNEVMILGACAIQLLCRVLREWGPGMDDSKMRVCRLGRGGGSADGECHAT